MDTKPKTDGPQSVPVAKTAEAAATHSAIYPALGAPPEGVIVPEDRLTDLITRIVDRTVARVLAHLAVPQAAAAASAPAPEPPQSLPARRQTERAALSLREAGQMIGVSAKTLSRQHKLGNLRCLRVGGQWRVTVAEVHAFLRRNERKD